MALGCQKLMQLVGLLSVVLVGVASVVVLLNVPVAEKIHQVLVIEFR